MASVGVTGVIFAAIAVAWLAYLVPLYLRSRDAEAVTAEGDADRFADSMRVIARGAAQLVDHDGAPLRSVEVSTPLTRRAAVRDLRRIEAQAAARRRRALVSLMVLATAVLVVCALGYLPWWAMAAPAGLVVAFVVVARISVRVIKRGLDERFAQIVAASDEATVFLRRVEEEPGEPSVGIQLKAPVRTSNALWDPLPITVPTYVSKPLAPRTVRTIDLSGPGVTSSGRGTADVPVTADGPAIEAVEQPDTPVAPVAQSRAHGEPAHSSREAV